MKNIIIIISLVFVFINTNAQPPWSLQFGGSSSNFASYKIPLNPIMMATIDGCILDFDTTDYMGCFIDSLGTGNFVCVGYLRYYVNSGFSVPVYGNYQNPYGQDFFGPLNGDTLYWRIWDGSEQKEHRLEIDSIISLITGNPYNGYFYNAGQSYGFVTVYIEGLPIPDYTLSLDCYSLHIDDKSLEGAEVEYFFGDGFSTFDIDPLHDYTANGTYDITMSYTNECGTVDTTYQVVIDAFPVADFSYQQNNSNIDFTNLSECGESYLWEFGDTDTSSLFNASHNYSTGVYYVTLTTTSPIGQDNHVDTVTIVNGIAEIGFGQRIYPNPAKDFVYIEGLEHNSIVRLLDCTGKVLQVFDTVADKIKIDLQNYPSGLYFIEIERTSIVQKVILLKE